MQSNYEQIPPATLETLQAWVKTGRPMGSFCTAVVSNDLKLALMRADDDNIRALFDTVAWMYNEAPHNCWCSPECLDTWPKRFSVSA